MQRKSKSRTVRNIASVLVFGIVLLGIAGWSGAPATDESGGGISEGERAGVRMITEPPVQKTTAAIMAEPNAQISKVRKHRKGLKQPDRSILPSAPGAKESSQWPLADPHQGPRSESELFAPQTPGIQFNGATGPAETGAFPPDTKGAVGPTQFFVFLNGRMRTFNKTTGIADGVIDVDSDVFWAPVMTPPGAGEITFSTDPNVRFDRLSNRWFLNIIDVVLNSTTFVLTKPNRILIAVSDAASNGVISGSTVWTMYQFQGDPTLFTDYQSFGVDASAMYIGGNMFTLASAFSSTKGFVIPKAPALTGSALTVWAFSGLASGAGSGPFSPRGVDNYDPANTGSGATGYFIGVDNAVFGSLTMRRITDPGNTAVSPTISANIAVAVNSTTFPIPVTHLGNTGGTSGRLAGLDDRLFAAHMRNGRLWTAHNIRVAATGVASTASQARNGVRWYEVNVPAGGGAPSLFQLGTIFDAATMLADARQYWIPSVMVSGQGHAAIGYSTAGTPFYANAATSGRLVGDALGTTQAPLIYTASTTAYNPAGDPGGSGGRRWGDYSYTSLDPNDDMTMWTIQEYCNGTNTYGVEALQLKAPPPATPDSVGPLFVGPFASVIVAVRGTSTAGSGFYDPGPDLPAPHTPFNHLSVAVNRVTGAGTISVNSVTYQNPTHLLLDLNTSLVTTFSTFRIVVTNPDGQKDSSGAILTVDDALPVQLATFTGTFVTGSNVRLNWTTISEINNYGFEVQEGASRAGTFETIPGSFIPGHGTTSVPQHYSYTHAGASQGSNWYRLKQIDLDGSINYIEPILVSPVTVVSGEAAPAVFSLSQNYPNPFNPTTEIRFSVETSGQATLDVFNSLGQKVLTLFDEASVAGQYYRVQFGGAGLSSGIYFYRLQTSTKTELRKMMLLK